MAGSAAADMVSLTSSAPGIQGKSTRKAKAVDHDRIAISPSEHLACRSIGTVFRQGDKSIAARACANLEPLANPPFGLKRWLPGPDGSKKASVNKGGGYMAQNGTRA